MTAAYIAIAAVALLLLALVALYNGLVRARNLVDESWSGIDVQLKRRHDLVGNLVESVKGYAAHERETLQAATDARAAAVNAGGPQQSAVAEAGLTGPLNRLLAVAEAYPDLKASANFLQLQNKLADLENEIAASRRIYNSNAQIYNARIQSFPAMILAGPLGFKSREYFELPAGEGGPASVSF